jgi:phosphate-selective porin OprO and OprP
LQLSGTRPGDNALIDKDWDMRRFALAGTAAAAIAFLAAATPAATQQIPAALATTGAVATGGATGADTGTTQEPPFTLNIGARVQVRYSYLDPDGGDASGSFGIRRGRLSLSGSAYQRFDYAVQVELAGASARLLDANIRYELAPMAAIWLGQGKAPFGRQQLNSSGNLHLVDRAITDGRFAAGRQQGVALTGRTPGRTFEYAAGVYNGNGINEPNPNESYMYAGRAVWTPLGAYAPVESAHDYPASPRLALGVAGMRNTVGIDEDEMEISRLGLEGAFKVLGFNTVGEFYREWATPVAAASFDTDGWYVQAGYLLPNRRHELAARYAVISPDTPGNTDIVETGIGYSLYFNAHRAKLQSDLRSIERKALDTNDLELRVQFQLTI